MTLFFLPGSRSEAFLLEGPTEPDTTPIEKQVEQADPTIGVPTENSVAEAQPANGTEASSAEADVAADADLSSAPSTACQTDPSAAQLIGVDEIRRIIGKNIRKYRNMRGLSQNYVGNYCGFSHQQQQKYENSDNRVPSSTLALIAQALDVSVCVFFEGVDKASGSSGGPELTKDELNLVRHYRALASPKQGHILDLIRAIARSDTSRFQGKARPGSDS